MTHKHRAVLAALLTVGASGWMATAALSAPAAPAAPTALVQESLAVVGSGTSVVVGLDEQGNANQTEVDAGDSQAAENDTNLQEGDSGTHEDDTANESKTQTGDNPLDGNNSGAAQNDTSTNGAQNDTGTNG